MEQRTLVSGFSELKDLLIRTYNIDSDRSFIRLYFTEGRRGDAEILMHDFNDHSKMISVCTDLNRNIIPGKIKGNARHLVEKSLEFDSPSEFLNTNFILYGFFRF